MVNYNHYRFKVSVHDFRRIISLLVLFLMYSSLSTANAFYNLKDDSDLQSITQGKPVVIMGVVVDSQGEPIIGANVQIKGSGNGTITDINGKYKINVSVGEVLQVSYIGYKTQEVTVTNSNSLDIILIEETELLDEVVVVGYGTIRKKDLTGATSNIKGNALSARKTTQLSTALQGTTSGVLVTRSSSSPGAGASKIQVRGVTTIGDSSPLIIVDGVPYENINDVNANDVESMTVLKDAASASIYGSRAASGVILITTKRASEKDLKLSYNFEYGLEIPTTQPKQVPFQRYMEMANELKYNDNPSGGIYSLYSEDQVKSWVANNPVDPDNYPITDWYELLVKKTAPRQTHTLNISGGSKNVKTIASLSFDKIDGLFKDAELNYKRYLVRVNNDIKISKYWGASLDLRANYAVKKEPAFTGIWKSIRVASPAYAYKWQHGGLADVKGGNNPYARLVEGGFQEGSTTKIGGKISLDFTPIKGLKVSAVFAPNFTISKDKIFNKKAGYTSQDDPYVIVGTFAGCESTNLMEKRNDSRSLTSQILATYTNKIGKNDFNLMLGYENYYYFHESLNASRDQYELVDFPYLNSGPKNYLDNGGSAYENAYRSYFGRIIYSFDNRYLLQANIRRDGSSRFHKDHRWGVFPSFSIGWIVSEESFLKKLNLNWLSFLKLRGSWGRLGNERIGNYPYVSLMDFTNSLFYENNKALDPTFYTGAAQIQYAMRDLTWETTESYDFGIDMHFFDSRLSVTADYYYKKTKDMLLDLEIPKYVGFSNPSQNAGRMHTKGVDLEINWNDNIGKFKYGISVNFSDYLSRMDYLSGTQFLGDKVKMEGSLFNEWYGYISDGIFQSDEEVKNSPTLNSNTKVGDIKYKDISGPKGVPDGVISPEYDRVLLGNSQPRFMYGATLYGSFKGLDFNVAFQGIGKQNVRMTEDMVQPYQNQWGCIPDILDGNYWSSFNSSEQNLSAKFPRLTYVNMDSNNSMSTFWMFNGKYLRLKNITLGYTLPKSFAKKIFLNNVRFYVSASDLFCISNYPKGWDPERGDSAYPITTSLIFGLSVNF